MCRRIGSFKRDFRAGYIVPHTVFLSWQADTPTSSGRNFIERALKDAVDSLHSDLEIEQAVRDELAIDRDTQGVPGTPPIVETIFNKINAAAVFVPDLTFVGERRDGRLTPNPNVLVEYGWALKALGHSCMVPIMNTEFGSPDGGGLPFDMRHLRNPLCYALTDAADAITRQRVRMRLAGELSNAISLILRSRPAVPAEVKPAFEAKSPKDGQARFRLRGEPLGISDGRGFRRTHHPVSATQGPTIWMRVMPCFAPGRSWSASDLRQMMQNTFLSPVGGDAYRDFSHIRADDGFGIYGGAVEDTESPVVTFIFETGEIWSLNAYLIEAHGAIPMEDMHLDKFLKVYADFLNDKLGIPRPLRWIAGVEGVNGLPLQVNALPPFDKRGHCVSDCVMLEGLLLPGQDAIASIQPFIALVRSKCL